MTFLILILVLVCFVYLVSKLNNLEFRIKKLEKSGIIAPVEQHSSPLVNQTAAAPTVPAFQQAPVASVQSVPAKPSPIPSKDIEFEFGGKFFTIVGAIAVFLGVGFFLRYAINQNLITESMRVVLGGFVGVALIITGEVLRKKYDSYSQVLQGTGIGVFYITLFSAYSSYELIGQESALIFMCIVSALGVALALRANSQHLAAVAETGAYLTPFMVGALSGNAHELFIYVFIVNIAMLLLAMLKSWRGVTLGGLFGTAVLFISWYSISFSNDLWPTAMLYVTLFFLTFLSANIYRYFVQKHQSDPNDLVLVMFNPLFTFLSNFAVLQNVDKDYVGLVAFILAAIYFFLGYLIPDDNPDAKTFHFGVCSILFLIGVPILFDAQWVTIAWAAFGVVLLSYAAVKPLKVLEYIAHCVIMFAFLRFLVIDLFKETGGLFIFNGRAFSLLVVASLMIVGAYVLHRQNSKQSADGTPALPTDKGMEVLAIQAHILVVAWVGVEFVHFKYGYLIGILWALSALLLFDASRLTKDLSLRFVAYLTAFIAAFRVVVYDTPIVLQNYTILFNTRVLAIVGVAIVLSLMLHALNKAKSEMEKEEHALISKIFFFGINLILLWVLSLEVSSYFDKKISLATVVEELGLQNAKRVGLSVGWSLYASLMLVLGIAWKSASARLFSIALFALVIFKVFLYDTANLPDFYRFVSFLSLGLVLLVVGYLYNKYKERIEEFIKVEDKSL